VIQRRVPVTCNPKCHLLQNHPESPSREIQNKVTGRKGEVIINNCRQKNDSQFPLLSEGLHSDHHFARVSFNVEHF
jgi:hypothetical protein